MASGNDVAADSCAFLADSVEDTNYLYLHNLICSILNCFFIFPCIIGNVLVIMAISKTPSLQTSSNSLVLALASSDLAVGVIAQPALSAWRLSQIASDLKVSCVVGVLSENVGWLLAGVSLFVITAISCERFLALHLHLRYNDIVTRRRLAKVVLSFWFIWAIITILRFFVVNMNILRIIAIIFLVISSLIMFAAYVMIYRLVRKHQRQIRQQCFIIIPSESNKLIDMARYKRSTLTMLYILGFFLLCYFPFLTVMVVEIAVGVTLKTKAAYFYTVTTVYINSALNPVIYCWRLREMRLAIRKLVNINTNFTEAENSFSLTHAKRLQAIQTQKKCRSSSALNR